MKLLLELARPGWSEAELRSDARYFTTHIIPYSVQWALALAEVAVITGVPAHQLDAEVWAQLEAQQVKDGTRTLRARKTLLQQIIDLIQENPA